MSDSPFEALNTSGTPTGPEKAGSAATTEAGHPEGGTGTLPKEGSCAPVAPPPFGLFYRTGFLLASMVAGISSVSIKQLLLPIQIGLLDPQNTNTSFALVSALGALAGLLAAPITGALADRTCSRLGRRRPWLIVGIVVAVMGLLIMAVASNIPVLLVGEILEQIGVDAILSNVTALIPEQVPEQEWARTSSLNGLAPIMGGVVGLVLLTTLTSTRLVSQGYLLLAIICLSCVGLFLLVLREPPFPPTHVAPFHLGAFLASFVHPLRSWDFVFTLLSRFMVFVTFTLLGSYLLFYVRGVLHASVPVAARSVTLSQLISTTVLILAALLAGSLSRRFARLKPFVVLGALIMALGIFVIVLFPTWPALYVAAGLFGAGFGLYVGVDIALAVRVLPSDLSRGKDLGIMYTSIFVPLIITPIVGASILNHAANSFALLFTVAAIASVLAAGLIVPIRSVK